MIIQAIVLVAWAKASLWVYGNAAASLTLAGAVGILFLTIAEHERSVRPSSLISVYLLARIAADAVILRTLGLRGYIHTAIGPMSASVGVQIVLLILESCSKRTLLKDQTHGAEETAGVFARSVLWWLNGLLWRGSQRVLEQSSLFELDSGLRSERLGDRILLRWDAGNVWSLS